MSSLYLERKALKIRTIFPKKTDGSQCDLVRYKLSLLRVYSYMAPKKALYMQHVWQYCYTSNFPGSKIMPCSSIDANSITVKAKLVTHQKKNLGANNFVDHRFNGLSVIRFLTQLGICSMVLWGSPYCMSCIIHVYDKRQS